MGELMSDVVLGEGKFLRLVSKNGWECVERKGCTGVVGIIALTPDNCILLVEQFRPPIGQMTIEIPAGLVGDVPGEDDRGNPEETAALRELMEETGYAPRELTRLFNGPTTTGMSAETITIFFAEHCFPMSQGGGVDDEKILVHKVPLNEAFEWICNQAKEGKVIDLKVRMALLMLCPPFITR